jgi:hypothetical protein
MIKQFRRTLKCLHIQIVIVKTGSSGVLKNPSANAASNSAYHDVSWNGMMVVGGAQFGSPWYRSTAEGWRLRMNRGWGGLARSAIKQVELVGEWRLCRARSIARATTWWRTAASTWQHTNTAIQPLINMKHCWVVAFSWYNKQYSDCNVQDYPDDVSRVTLQYVHNCQRWWSSGL